MRCDLVRKTSFIAVWAYIVTISLYEIVTSEEWQLNHLLLGESVARVAPFVCYMKNIELFARCLHTYIIAYFALFFNGGSFDEFAEFADLFNTLCIVTLNRKLGIFIDKVERFDVFIDGF